MDIISSFLSDEKTTYTITDEHGERSSITIKKFVADVLQAELPDVHLWVQAAYDRVVEKKPNLSRREKGNLVRELAEEEARKSKIYQAARNAWLNIL